MAEEANPPKTGDAPGEPAVDPAPASEGVPPPERDWATRFKYLLADFENFRRRVDKERETVRRDVKAGVLSRILPLYEATLRAHDAVGRLPASDPVRRGMDLLVEEWEMFLENEGIEPVAVVGAPFEAAWHEAVAEAPPGARLPAGSVVEIVQQGYRLNQALLRPAKVVVARVPPTSASREREPALTGDPDAPGGG